jgi:hypothetical protein
LSGEDDTQLITVRVPKELLQAFDKTTPDKERTKTVRDMMEQRVVQFSGGQPLAMNLEKLKAQTDDSRREMERLRKVLNDRKGAVERVALREIPLTIENIPAIIQYIREYVRKGIKAQDGFSTYNVEDYISFLEAMKNHDEVQRDLDKCRDAKPGAGAVAKPDNVSLGKAKVAKKERRYIAPEDRCSCGIYELKAEHNPRCFHVHDGMRHGIDPTNLNTGTPKGQLMMIRKFGMDHTTSAEEKTMVVDYLKEEGTVNQKILVNHYFLSHNFDVPFPELSDRKFEEEEEAEDETVTADSSESPADTEADNDA